MLVWDGASGTQFQRMGLSDADFTLAPGGSFDGRLKEAAERLGGKVLEGCNDILSITRPDVVEKLHESYYAVGSDIVETNSFGSTSIVLGEYEVPELVYDVSLAAAQCARRAADRWSQIKPRFVGGGIGPGTKLVSLGQTTWQELERTYCDSARGLLDGGVDLLLLETLQDLLMVKASIVACHRAMVETGRRVPIIVQVTMEQNGTMLVGSEIAAALNMVECFPAVVAFGMNCATGPVEMAPHVKFLGENSTRPVSVQPNAWLPTMEGGQAV